MWSAAQEVDFTIKATHLGVKAAFTQYFVYEFKALWICIALP